MDKAKLKVLFRIPRTIYWLATATYNINGRKIKLFCLAIKEFDKSGKYFYHEISEKEDIDCARG